MTIKQISAAFLVIATAVLLVDAGTNSRAETPKKSSSIDVTTSTKGDLLTFKFKVVPAADMVINEDGPWKLEVKRADALKFAKEKLDRSEIDFKIPGYSITTTAKPTATKGDLSYKMIVFVCTKDKTICMRDVHDGTYSWAGNP